MSPKDNILISSFVELKEELYKSADITDFHTSLVESEPLIANQEQPPIVETTPKSEQQEDTDLTAELPQITLDTDIMCAKW